MLVLLRCLDADLEIDGHILDIFDLAFRFVFSPLSSGLLRFSLLAPG